MSQTTANDKDILKLVGVSQHFGGVTALDDVDFALRRGEIHGLVGENGAGKSTLVKILSGVHTGYTGEMYFRGEVVRFRSPADAKARGIGVVYQELSVIRPLSVAENLFLGSQPTNKLGLVNWKQMKDQASDYLEQLGLRQIDVTRPVGAYAIGVQQMVEVARVLFSGAEVIILDEPTSALSPPEAERLFEFMERLKTRQKTMIFITHFLEDVLRVSDRISILKNGRMAAVVPRAEADKTFLIHKMIGQEAQSLIDSYANQADHSGNGYGQAVLEVKDLRKQREFDNINLTVHEGEILGVYGFMGAGKTALANCLFGYQQPDSGTIHLQGRPIKVKSTDIARKQGIAYVSDNRKASIFPGKEIYKNVTLTYLDRIMGFFISKKPEVEATREQITRVGVLPPNPFLDIAHLSGGNQQKAVLAKWLVQTPHVLILNEPTRGMDVGAKDEVLALMHQLKKQGMAILLISSEPEIILGNSDNIIVMSKGKITQAIPNRTMTKDRLMQWA